MPQQPNNGWTPVEESGASSGWTPVQENSDQGGPTARFLTRATGLPVHDIVEHPGAYLNPLSKEYWDKGKQERAAEAAAPLPTGTQLIPGHQTYEDIKSGNYAGAAGDVAGTAAAVAPLLFGGREMAPGETPSAGPKSVATAPVRAGARLAEAALNKTVKPVSRLFTPADEAVEPIKVPGRDFGLPKRGAIAQGMDPASSPSRTLPGQLPPEQIVPPAAKPADPIPPRSGLVLPAAPVGAELAELPATGAKPASQTGEALGQIKRGSIAKSVQPPKQLPEAFQPLPPKAPPVPGTVDAPFQGTPQRGSIASAMQPQSTPPIARGSISQMLQQQLEESMGGRPLNPKMPLRSQIDAAQPEADMPQGHTAVQSSAMRSKLYDPAAQEFHARLTSGDTTYVYGDVSPDEAQAFESAKSKGQAFQTIKQNHPLVAKIVNGKRVAVSGRGSISAGMQK